MSSIEFYSKRAAECRAEAEATRLANVRERCLNSAAAWDGMAERLRRTEAFRAEDALRKAEQGRAGAARE